MNQHPLGQLVSGLGDVFRASYVGMGTHRRLLPHAVAEVKSFVIRVYNIVRWVTTEMKFLFQIDALMFLAHWEVAIFFISPCPINLRYSQTIGCRSRQITTNQIGPDDHDASDWSSTMLGAQGVIARAKWQSGNMVPAIVLHIRKPVSGPMRHFAIFLICGKTWHFSFKGESVGWTSVVQHCPVSFSVLF